MSGFNPSRCARFIAVASSLLLGIQTFSPAVAYTKAKKQIIANPERGIYYHTETKLSGGKSTEPLRDDNLENQYGNGRSLILRLYYIDKSEQDISNSFAPIEEDLTYLRSVGMKAILRFAYSDDGKGEFPNANDASVDTAIKHIGQLKPLFEKYVDVIAVVQAGFMGTWGEWFAVHGDYGAPFPGNCPLNQNRRKVIDALLAALPSVRAIQLRSSYYKHKYAVNGSVQNTGRIGLHNDAFGGKIVQQRMIQMDDQGGPNCLTEANQKGIVDCYKEPDKPLCKTVSEETQKLPMGGEVGDRDYLEKDKYEWKAVLQDFKRNHWSYLDPRSSPEIAKAWNGHFDELADSLGYRFLLTSSSFKKSVKNGEALSVSLKLKNVGWAAPFNARNVRLVLIPVGWKQKENCPAENGVGCKSLVVDKDPRTWLPLDPYAQKLPNGKMPQAPEYTIEGTLAIDKLPVGDYYLALELADPLVKIEKIEAALKQFHSQQDPRSIYARYAIRLADISEDDWDTVNGLNYLGKVKITN